MPVFVIANGAMAAVYKGSDDAPIEYLTLYAYLQQFPYWSELVHLNFRSLAAEINCILV